jgi:hypothetical protein
MAMEVDITSYVSSVNITEKKRSVTETNVLGWGGEARATTASRIGSGRIQS